MSKNQGVRLLLAAGSVGFGLSFDLPFLAVIGGFFLGMLVSELATDGLKERTVSK